MPDDTLRRLLGLATVRDRAILLLLLDTGLRVSEAAGIRLGDLRPDGSVKVMGKGAKERIVPIGSTARTAIVRYLGERGPGVPCDLEALRVHRSDHLHRADERDPLPPRGWRLGRVDRRQAHDHVPDPQLGPSRRPRPVDRLRPEGDVRWIAQRFEAAGRSHGSAMTTAHPLQNPFSIYRAS